MGSPYKIGLPNVARNSLPYIAGASTRRSRRQYLPQVLTFSNTALWNPGASYSATEDVINWIAGAGKAVKLTDINGDGFGANCTLAAPIDVTGCLVRTRFYMHPGEGATDPSNTTAHTLRLYSGAGLTDGVELPLWSTYNNTGKVGDNPYYYNTGWCEAYGSMPIASVIGGTFAPSDLRTVRINFSSNATGRCAITLDSIEFIPKLTRPLFAFTFDDGYISNYEAAAYMASKGLRGTFFVVPSRVGGTGTENRMTLQQLWRMRDCGHLIANHGYTHAFGPNGYGFLLNSFSDQQVIDDICKGSEWLCGNGFSEGARIFATPGGSTEWKPAYNGLILGKYCDIVRNSAAYNVNIGRQAIYHVQGSDGDLATVTALIDRAITTGGIVIENFHSTAANIAVFKQIVDYAATKAAIAGAGGIDVVTMDEIP